MIKPYNYGVVECPTFYRESGEPFNGTSQELNEYVDSLSPLGYIDEETGIVVLIGKIGKILAIGYGPEEK